MFVCRACARRVYPSFFRSLRLETTAARTLSYPRHEPRRSASTAAVAVPAAVDRLDGKSLTPVERDSLEWAVKQQLRYLKDPFKIGQYVETALAKGRFDEALLLTRKASKDKMLTVSWNHLIQHQFRDQKLHAAMKLFNEVSLRPNHYKSSRSPNVARAR